MSLQVSCLALPQACRAQQGTHGHLQLIWSLSCLVEPPGSKLRPQVASCFNLLS